MTIPLGQAVRFFMSTHSIRLRGPWQYEVLSAEAPPKGPTSGTLKMPSDWGDSLGSDFRGRVLYRRRFNCPTGLTGQSVKLCFLGAEPEAQISLNGQKLGRVAGTVESTVFSVTDLLQPHNELTAEFDTSCSPSHQGPGGLTGEVRLVIEPAEPIS